MNTSKERIAFLVKVYTDNSISPEEMKELSEVTHQPQSEIIFSDLLQVAEKAISRLPKQQQIVFRMSKLEGLSYEEIGIKLNISKNTVKNHFVVASRTLRVQLHSEVGY